jgi:ABC-type Na+ efflux pump permease subunit
VLRALTQGLDPDCKGVETHAQTYDPGLWPAQQVRPAGAVYVISLLGVPIVSGVLAGLRWIRFWLAALACLAVVALDVVFDETRAEDAGFFAVLAVVMVGIAALALWVTRQIVRRRGGRLQGGSN